MAPSSSALPGSFPSSSSDTSGGLEVMRPVNREGVRYVHCLLGAKAPPLSSLDKFVQKFQLSLKGFTSK